MPEIMMNISNMVEQSGKLLKVESYSFPDLPEQLACLYLQFEKVNIYIKVLGDTDEIEVSDSPDFEEVIATSNNPIWEQFINKDLIWAWDLINNQGYKDGVRLEFKDSKLSIEFIAMASSIWIYKSERA